MYTYTVTPMYHYYRETLPGGLSTLSRTPDGFQTTVRDGDQVVHQFPRLQRQDLCHKMAQRHILSLKAAASAASLIQKVMQ
jgi:hypothetical protein